MLPEYYGYHPVLVSFGTNKTYIITGGAFPWMVVPDNTKTEDVPNFVKWLGHSWQKDEVVAVDVPKERIFEVVGSKGDKYKVRRDTNGMWYCSCAGYGFRRKCSHIDGVKEKNNA